MSFFSCQNLAVIFFITLLNTFPHSGFAQSDSVIYYFDKDLNSCEAKDAAFVGIGVKDNSLVRFSNYTNPEGKLVLSGFFTDYNLSTREGEFRYYDPEGKLSALENYKSNVLNGYVVKLTKGYIVTDSLLYETGVNISGITYVKDDAIHKTSRTTFDNRSGSKEIITYSMDGSVQSKGNWINGDGIQVTYFPHTEKAQSIATHKSSRLVSMQYFNEDGTVDISKKDISQKIQSYKSQQEGNTPSYQGGLRQFGDLFVKKLEQRFPNLFNGVDGRSGVYTLVFNLDSKGAPCDLKVEGLSPNSSLLRKFKMVLEDNIYWDMKGHESYGPINFTLTIN